MLITIKRIVPNAQYENKIYDYLLYGTTINGIEVLLFDYQCLSVNLKTGDTIDCLLSVIGYDLIDQNIDDIPADNDKKICDIVLSGTYSCRVPETVKENYSTDNLQNFGFMICDFGVILLDLKTSGGILIEKYYKEGQTIKIRFISHLYLRNIKNSCSTRTAAI